MLSQQEISDHIEISQLIQRYGMALDERKWHLLDRVFSKDADLRYRYEEQVDNGPLEHWKQVFESFLMPAAE